MNDKSPKFFESVTEIFCKEKDVGLRIMAGNILKDCLKSSQKYPEDILESFKTSIFVCLTDNNEFIRNSSCSIISTFILYKWSDLDDIFDKLFDLLETHKIIILEAINLILKELLIFLETDQEFLIDILSMYINELKFQNKQVQELTLIGINFMIQKEEVPKFIKDVPDLIKELYLLLCNLEFLNNPIILKSFVHFFRKIEFIDQENIHFIFPNLTNNNINKDITLCLSEILEQNPMIMEKRLSLLLQYLLNNLVIRENVNFENSLRYRTVLLLNDLASIFNNKMFNIANPMLTKMINDKNWIYLEASIYYLSIIEDKSNCPEFENYLLTLIPWVIKNQNPVHVESAICWILSKIHYVFKNDDDLFQKVLLFLLDKLDNLTNQNIASEALYIFIETYHDKCLPLLQDIFNRLSRYYPSKYVHPLIELLLDDYYNEINIKNFKCLFLVLGDQFQQLDIENENTIYLFQHLKQIFKSPNEFKSFPLSLYTKIIKLIKSELKGSKEFIISLLKFIGVLFQYLEIETFIESFQSIIDLCKKNQFIKESEIQEFINGILDKIILIMNAKNLKNDIYETASIFIIKLSLLYHDSVALQIERFGDTFFNSLNNITSNEIPKPQIFKSVCLLIRKNAKGSLSSLHHFCNAFISYSKPPLELENEFCSIVNNFKNVLGIEWKSFYSSFPEDLKKDLSKKYQIN